MNERTWMVRAVAGEISDLASSIDDLVDDWHSGQFPMTTSLAQCLGFTAKEYERWVRHPSQLAAIVANRRELL